MESESVGERLKRLRKEKKISVTKIVEVTGISRSNYYRYESGEINKMPYTSLIPIAKLMDVSPAYLLSGRKDEENNYNELVENLKETIGDIKLTNKELAEITSYTQYIISQRKCEK
jgi:transcriptional regulator with XRE-family HTH domain